ncbi:chemotaxis protein CheB [Leptolyngbya sp. NK1-12]|uniref:protein-glutamate methylesterase n=1 Tax=Leptolyngbya sp. NK1-12 TaxID=2547451 RepID=A0AA97ALA2_9CYAN|nr:chemotaxis protein CheB [Leptolyngbya sp. NK1-12]WNZ27226.1 chemotaxis protein CheB [Leptolyngbya sp. NK1-12]
MLNHVVAIAASSGGLEALSCILKGLPANFSAPIVIVQHLDPDAPSMLPFLLTRCTLLPVKHAESGAALHAGTVYIAPPNWHVLVNPDGSLSLAQTEKLNFTRPSADVLFESLAASYQQRAIAVVLTGRGQDGAVGIQKVKQARGLTIAQDPQTASFKGMPTAAIQTKSVDLILPLNQIAPTLVKLVQARREMTSDGFT